MEEKQKEECKNQQQNKDYSKFTLENLKNILKDLDFKYSKYNIIYQDSSSGGPNARKAFDKAIKNIIKKSNEHN